MIKGTKKDGKGLSEWHLIGFEMKNTFNVDTAFSDNRKDSISCSRS